MTNSVLLYNDDAYKRVNKLVSEGERLNLSIKTDCRNFVDILIAKI